MILVRRPTVLDERFFDRRQRSSSIAGLTGAAAASGLLLYRLYIDHVWSWDLFAVAATIAVVKLAMMAWYHFTD